MNNNLKDLKEQHFQNYKKVLIELLQTNTNVLFDDDITSLFKIPPLDSMDILKSKMIELGKSEQLIVDIDNLNNSLNLYREAMLSTIKLLKNQRFDYFFNYIDKFEYRENEIIYFYKKDFDELDKSFRRILKQEIIDSFDINIIKNVNNLFTKKDLDLSTYTKKLLKYFNSVYVRQIIEGFEMKLLVKDTILINTVKEQGERYIFTLKKSHIFDI